MKRIVVFGEALTYPPKEGITAHIFSTLEELAKLPDMQPFLVMADRGFFDTAIFDTLPWRTVLVPPDAFYDISAMTAIVTDIHPDIIQSYNVYQARLIGMPLAAQLNVPFVFEHHDLETELSTFLGLPKELAADNRRYQQDILHFASLNRVMSRYDYDILADSYRLEPEVQATLSWLPVSQADAFGCNPPKADTNKGVLFIGNGSYPPNAQAIDYILRVLAPAHPELQFHIVGRFTDTLCADYSHNNVTGYGQIDDLTSVVSQCFVGIIPISAGSGMKVKVLTYLSAGLPVAGPAIAFHGYGSPDVLLEAESAADYARHFTDLRTNHAWQGYGVAAREYFETSFDAAAIAHKLAAEYCRLTPGARPELAPISRNDSRLAWIHELRDTPYPIVTQPTHKGIIT